MIGIIGHQLRALGHDAHWNPANEEVICGPDGINLIVEGFTPESTRIIGDLKAQGSRFVIIASEEPTEKGFNHGSDAEMIARQKEFPAAAAHCEGILHLVPGARVGAWYSQFAPTAQIELGYAPTLVRPRDAIKDYGEPKFDFGFYGSLSKRRLKILKTLARMTGKQDAVRVVADFTTQQERDVGMAQAKVILQLRKFDAMGLVSSSRCCTALCIGRPIMAEPHDLELSKPWDEVVTFSKTLEGFFNQALLMRAAWRGAHAAQFDRFKTLLDPQYCVGDALAKIGVL